MALSVSWQVHNVSTQPLLVDAEIGGEKVKVTAASTEVELTAAPVPELPEGAKSDISPTNALHGSLTLRFMGASAKEAADYFKPGMIVTWPMTADKPAEAKPAKAT